MDVVQIIARCLCRHDGFAWNLLPSFKDHFTDGLSHEEYLEEARRLLDEELDPVGSSA